ncbi:MAG: hypothetical protein PHS73_03960, partial [Candidatus Peribacteraceae bacterium]|nr:hypothetical protein [Candidatus Peribacteraceae bacterium]
GTSPTRPPSEVQTLSRLFYMDIAHHRLCALTGMPQELIRHPHCGPERYAAAVSAVMTARRQSFYDVLVACLDRNDREDLYRELHARNGSSNNDHIYYAECCRARDRGALQRAWTGARSRCSALFRKSDLPDRSVIETLVDTALRGFAAATQRDVLACMERSVHEQFHELPDTCDEPSDVCSHRRGRHRKTAAHPRSSAAHTLTATEGKM